MNGKCFYISVFLLIVFFLEAKKCSIEDLRFVADGLNIEGGSISRKYLREGQIWANLCVILDRPFVDGVEWEQLTNSNIFPLKEASILSYNEAQVNLTYALILQYYLTHAHKIVNKADRETVRILIQVHRNTSGPRHVELLEQLLCECQSE